MHTYLRNAQKGQYVDCVYVLDTRSTDIERQINDESIRKRQVSSNGSMYVILYVKDCSLVNFEKAQVYFFYNSIEKLAFLRDGYAEKTNYLKIKGKVFETYPNIRLSTNDIIPANASSGIVFDTSDLYPYNEYMKSQMTSIDGKTNVPLRHTSAEEFQDSFDLIDKGTRLQYRRLYDSPFDKYQINVFIEGIDETFNIPAYLTPTMAKMIEDGYYFEITVSEVIPSNEEQGFLAGIRVTIKGRKNDFY